MAKKKRREVDMDEADPLLPIMNMVSILIPMLLYGSVFVSFVTLMVQAPKISAAPSQPQEQQKTLNLNLMITDQGFHFKVSPEFRLPWMSMATDTASAGPDIPKKDDDWDYQELNRKLKEIKQGHLQENQIIIGAEDDIKFEVLIKTMDYSRGTVEEPLFPDVVMTRGVV